MPQDQPLAGTVQRLNRGQRECRDIIDAAVEQGWRTKPAASGHTRLIPPGGGTPVGVSNTPSDVHFRHQIIRLMRRSGFVWPWPPEEKSPSSEPAAVPEIWLPIPHCSVAEVSNGGHLRRHSDHKPFYPGENGLFSLTDDEGRVRTFSLRAVVRGQFGHSPIKHVVPQKPKKPEGTTHQEEIMTTKTHPAREYYAVPESSNGQGSHYPPALRDKRWEPVLIEGITEGYEVNEDSDILAPKNDKFRERKLLSPSRRSTGRMWVNLRGTDGVYRQYPVDEIVLEAFTVRPGPGVLPEHKDGDGTNCAVSNLQWKTPISIDPAVEAQAREVLSRQAQVEAAAEPEPEPYEHQAHVDAVVAEAPRVAVKEEAVEQTPEPQEETTEEARKRKDRERKRAATRAKKKDPRHDEVEMLRTYRFGGISLVVDAEGRTDLSKAKKLTPAEVAAVAKLAEMATEMNKVMGLT